MVLFGWLRAMELLEKVVAGEMDALPQLPPAPEEPWEGPEETGAAQQAQQAADAQQQGPQQAAGRGDGAALVPLAGTAWGATQQQAVPLQAGRKHGRG